MLLSIAISGMAAGVTSVLPVDHFMKCCEMSHIGEPHPVGTRCSDQKSRYACYVACQKLCGDPDSINGKKCRQMCNIRWAGDNGWNSYKWNADNGGNG